MKPIKQSSNSKSVVSALRKKVADAPTDPTLLSIELRKSVLAGDFFTNHSTEHWRSPPWKMLVYLSSAFSDCKIERELLITQIMPSLRKQAAVSGISVDIIDMRWGMKDEFQLDEISWQERQRELERCKNESSGIFFLSLLGDKYGITPLPHRIPQSIFEKCLTACTQADRSLASTWYRLDHNSVPDCEYVLNPKTDMSDSTFHTESLPKLCRALEGSKFDSKHCDDLVVGRSICEWESKLALHLDPGRSRMRWSHRRFEGGAMKFKDERDFFDDPADRFRVQKLADLKAQLQRALPPASIVNHTEFTFDCFLEKDLTWSAYLENFRINIHAILAASLTDVCALRVAWDHNCCGLGVSGAMGTEMLHHCELAHEYCSNFVGRETVLSEAFNRIIVDSETIEIAKSFTHAFDDEASPLECITLALVGCPGSGKSALMAKLADLVFKEECSKYYKRPVIIRFCGTSFGSQTGLSLINSLCAQIHLLVGLKSDFSRISESYAETIVHFHSLLAKYPIVLFLDGVDQLVDEDFACSQLSFLRGAVPHRDSRIILSTQQDVHDPVTNHWVKYFGCSTRLLEENIPILFIRKFQVLWARDAGAAPFVAENDSSEDVMALHETVIMCEKENCRQFVEQLLLKRNRTLTEYQMELLLTQCRKDPTPLFATLALDLVANWTSNSTMLTPLFGGVARYVSECFDSLAADFGALIVKHVIGFITFSVQGVSDEEIEDLLSINEAVIDASKSLSGSQIQRFSTHIWLRIRGRLNHLFSLRNEGCLAWTHSIIKETAILRFSDEERKEIHALMARYFSNMLDPNVKSTRGINSQPLLLNGTGGMTVWKNEARINIRRCIEAGKHLIEAELFEAATVELCDIEGICARAKCGLSYALVDELSTLDEKVHNTRVDHYVRWIGPNIGKIMTCPPLFLVQTCSMQPLLSAARKDMRDLMIGYTEKQDFSSTSWIRSVCLGGAHDFGAQIGILEGHSNRVTALSWSPDGHRFLSASWDKTLKIWDPNAGTLSHTSEGHSAAVTCISWSPNSHQFASSSWDNTVAIWDSLSGAVDRLLEQHSDFVCCVSWSFDGHLLASGSYDSTVILWNTMTGNVARVLRGHLNWVVALAWRFDSKLIASASYDKTVRVWNAETGDLKFLLANHLGSVLALAWSADGHQLASGSLDKTVKIWDANVGALLYSIDSIQTSVHCLAWNHNASRLAIGAADFKIRVWETSSRKMLNTLTGHSDIVTAICWSPDRSKLASGSADKTIRMWDSLALEKRVLFDGHHDVITCVSWSYNGNFVASSSTDKTIVLWDVMAESLFKVLIVGEPVSCVHWRKDDKQLLSATSVGSAVVWNAITGEEVCKYAGDGNPINAVAWNKVRDIIALGMEDTTIRLLDVFTFNVTHVLQGHTSAVSCLDFSPSGTFLASGSVDNVVRVWNTITNAEIIVYHEHTNWVTSIKYSLDGKYLASGSHDHSLRIWDATYQTQNSLHVIEIGDVISSLCWDFNSQHLIFGADDKTVYYWKYSDLEPVPCALVGHSEGITTVACSPDGGKIVSGSKDKTVRIWDSVSGRFLLSREQELALANH